MQKCTNFRAEHPHIRCAFIQERKEVLHKLKFKIKDHRKPVLLLMLSTSLILSDLHPTMLNSVRQHNCFITQGCYIGYMFRLLISHLQAYSS